MAVAPGCGLSVDLLPAFGDVGGIAVDWMLTGFVISTRRFAVALLSLTGCRARVDMARDWWVFPRLRMGLHAASRRAGQSVMFSLSVGVLK